MSPHDLLKLNVGDHIEKKQGLSYLSWAWAWAEALKADTNANFNVHDFGGKPYMEINGTAMVWVTVTMFGKAMTCFLPVMNGGNRPITIEGRNVQTRNGTILEKIDSFNVNTAIMRCMVKCLALHGLGLYIYAGEDLPEDSPEVQEAQSEPAKPAPAPVKKEAPTRPAPDAQATANAQLFADSMLEYIKICADEEGLKSYWKANQSQLDGLKADFPEMYAGIVEKFKALKAEFTAKKSV
jgi:hypothetical protein